jgi:PD-(D/E)XK nuclease superfamily
MDEYKEIENLLNIVKSRIDTHNEFKKEYDKQLAFDFSLFNFFPIGENKVSQILAYFLDEKQNHGQGNLFLNEFVKTFYNKEIDTKHSKNICEKIITENRRIDIYIELNGLIIAIENKIWADDQHNQLKDYTSYLEKKSKGNYLLLYLNPYGTEPTTKSIDENTKANLIQEEKFKIISYKNDIINLINNWLIICEADNVSYFLKEFKKYLEIKFLGKNTLNMSKDLRTIIENNKIEVQQLVKEYKDIENEVLNKLNLIGKELDKINIIEAELKIVKHGLFNWDNTRVYKYSISKNQNKVWVQFVKKEIDLISCYYLQEGTDQKFNEILKDLNVNNNLIIDHKKNIPELITVLLNQIEIAKKSFEIYENFIHNQE